MSDDLSLTCDRGSRLRSDDNHEYESSAELARVVQRGDELWVLRRNVAQYGHAGIVYYDDGRQEWKVVNYTAEEYSFSAASIVVTTLAEFMNGDKVIIKPFNAMYSRDEVVARARAQVGKGRDAYTLWGNNCQHFTSWCHTNKAYSPEIDQTGDTALKVAGVLAVVAAAIAGTGAYLKYSANSDKANNQYETTDNKDKDDQMMLE